MKKLWPYLLIAVAFCAILFSKHPEIFNYKLTQESVRNYLRSQDIEDPNDLIKDRVVVGDGIIYSASGFLYATGSDPTKYNFQHPPLIKYLFGFSTLITENPFWVQIIFGFIFLSLTYFLSTKILKDEWLSFIPVGLLLMDPIFRGMMSETLLDLGQAVFALGYIISTLLFPGSFILQGILLGLFAASKFWTTAIIIATLIFAYKFIRKDKLDLKKILISFFIAFIIFSLTYIKSFIDNGGMFNIFAFEGRVLKFMLLHNSAKQLGGPIILFVTGYFAPWWQEGVVKALDWIILWPIGLIASIIVATRTKISDNLFFICLLPIIYLLSGSSQVPFTRYFIILLPFVYIGLTESLKYFIEK